MYIIKLKNSASCIMKIKYLGLEISIACETIDDPERFTKTALAVWDKDGNNITKDLGFEVEIYNPSAVHLKTVFEAIDMYKSAY